MARRMPEVSERLLPRRTTVDGWTILTIPFSVVPGFDIATATKGMSENDIKREYYISWSSSSGAAVYPTYNADIHVARAPLCFDPGRPLIAGIDFGGCPAAVFSQLNGYGQWLILSAMAPPEGLSLGTYEFGEQLADHLLHNYASPYGLEIDQLTITWFGDPAGNAPPALGRSNPGCEARTHFEILRDGIYLPMGVGEEGEPITEHKPGWGWDIIPGAVSIPERLEAVRARLSLILHGGLPAFLVDPRCEPIKEAMGGGYCVDEETECLTAEGWKRYDVLRVGEPIYIYLASTNRLRLAPLQAVNVFDGPEQVLSFQTDHVDMLVTPNHRCPVIKRHYQKTPKRETFSEPHFVPADALNGQHYLLPLCHAEKDGGDFILTNDLVRLCAWVSAEGHYHICRAIYISQSVTQNPECIATLDGLCQRIPGLTRQPRVDLRGCVQYVLTGDYAALVKLLMPEKHPTPWFIQSMSARQRMLFLYEYLRGDGHWGLEPLPDREEIDRESDFWIREGTPKIYVYSRPAADALQMVATLAGMQSHLYAPGSDRGYVLSLTKRPAHGYAVRNLRRGQATVNRVWCPATEAGTWVARRNGLPFITGNSYKQRADGRYELDPEKNQSSHVSDALGYIASRLFVVPQAEERGGPAREVRSRASGRRGRGGNR